LVSLLTIGERSPFNKETRKGKKDQGVFGEPNRKSGKANGTRKEFSR